jgi:hypothetical protein
MCGASAALAQLGERLFRKQGVAGSIPAGGSMRLNPILKFWLSLAVGSALYVGIAVLIFRWA